MNSTNQKSPGARGIPQPFKRQAGHAPQFKPGVAQLKNAASAQSVKQPVASPAYRQQGTPKAAQPKMANGAVNRNPPVAPLVYCPQQTPEVLQTKSLSAQSPQTGQVPRQPIAPAVYGRRAKPVGAQAKMAGSPQLKNHPSAPQVYRPQSVPKVLQTKKAASQRAGQGQQGRISLTPPVAGVAQPAKFSVQAKGASNIPLHKLPPKGQQLPKHGPTRVVQPRAGLVRNPSGSGVAVKRGASVGHSNVSGVVQRYPTLDDSGRKDAMIYCISTNDLTDIIYVGQTTDARAGDRFIEHVNNDAWAPWWVHKPNVYGDDESKWPYRVRTLEALKNVTKFETTAAEQWWLEKYLKEGKKLLNDSTACSLDCFQKRSIDPNLYDPTNIGVASSWKPSMKAK